MGDRIYSIPCCACCFSSYRPGAIHPFLYIVLVQFSLFFISSWYNYSFSLYRLGAVNPFLKIIQSRCKTASAVKKLNKFCPLNSSDDLCLLFCINPYPIGGLHLPPPGGGAGGQLGQETPCGRSQVRTYIPNKDEGRNKFIENFPPRYPNTPLKTVEIISFFIGKIFYLINLSYIHTRIK